jgi:hypothetical protein
MAVGFYKSQQVPDATWDRSSGNLQDVEGISFTEYSDNELSYKMESDFIRISPRKFSIFKIRIYDQASMQNVHIQSYLTSSNLKFEMFPLEKLNKIKKNICERFQLDIYRNGEHIFNISADKAIMDLIHKKTTLLKAVITNISLFEKIAGHSVVWDEEEQEFIISGTFLKETASGSTKGRGLRIDLYNHQNQI